jgi:serine/threonine protein kinase
METLRSQPTEDQFRAAVPTLGSIQERQLNCYLYGVVMPEADRSLQSIYASERPSLARVRLYCRQVAEAIYHMHEHGIAHLDIKLPNALRHDNRICITDLDASASMAQGKEQFAGSKFSSAILPPEMMYQLKSEAEIEAYNTYWSSVDRKSALWQKICPVNTGDESGHYVVRTFDESVAVPVTQSSEAGTHVNARGNALPYKLIMASPAIDIWSFGVLLFKLLFGVDLVAANRDDDLEGPDAMLSAATWTDEKLSARIRQLADKVDCPEAIDLLEKLLRAAPRDRMSSMGDVLFHPFFDTPSASHASEVTPFIALAKDNGMSPLDYLSEMASNMWKFRKLDAVLKQREWLPQDGLVANELFAVTTKVLRRSVQHVIALNEEAKTIIRNEVKMEGDRYDNVQKSILDNLVVTVEAKQYRAFNTMFVDFGAMVAHNTTKKAVQQTANAMELFNQASRVKPLFEKVRQGSHMLMGNCCLNLILFCICCVESGQLFVNFLVLYHRSYEQWNLQ